MVALPLAIRTMQPLIRLSAYKEVEYVSKQEEEEEEEEEGREADILVCRLRTHVSSQRATQRVCGPAAKKRGEYKYLKLEFRMKEN